MPGRWSSARLALWFSSTGHFFFHYLAAMYFTIVVALARDWQIAYHELIRLWTPAFVLIGLAALPAGRLADRWSPAGMLVLMFIGMGLFTIASGLVDSPQQLWPMLAGVGLFAAIYHPVGISWLVRSSEGNTGRKLAINGIFGGLGAAAAGGVSGLLLAQGGWRLAFVVPGLLCLAAGLLMLWCWRRGWLVETRAAAGASGAAGQRGRLGAFALMLLPMFAIGLIYNSTQTLMPKLFEERLSVFVGDDLARVGVLISLVYGLGALMQLAGGWLADRYPLKPVYLGLWLVQIPLLALMAASGDWLLYAVSVLLVIGNTAALPAENMLLARFAPARHHGLAFGVKFVLAFGAGPLGVELIALARRLTGDFSAMLYGLALLALVTVVSLLFLPAAPRREGA